MFLISLLWSKIPSVSAQSRTPHLNNSILLLADWKVYNCSINCLIRARKPHNKHGHLKSPQVALTVSNSNSITQRRQLHSILHLSLRGVVTMPGHLQYMLTQSCPCPNTCRVEEGREKKQTQVCILVPFPSTFYWHTAVILQVLSVATFSLSMCFHSFLPPSSTKKKKSIINTVNYFLQQSLVDAGQLTIVKIREPETIPKSFTIPACFCHHCLLCSVEFLSMYLHYNPLKTTHYHVTQKLIASKVLLIQMNCGQLVTNW